MHSCALLRIENIFSFDLLQPIFFFFSQVSRLTSLQLSQILHLGLFPLGLKLKWARMEGLWILRQSLRSWADQDLLSHWQEARSSSICFSVNAESLEHFLAFTDDQWKKQVVQQLPDDLKKDGIRLSWRSGPWFWAFQPLPLGNACSKTTMLTRTTKPSLLTSFKSDASGTATRSTLAILLSTGSVCGRSQHVTTLERVQASKLCTLLRPCANRFCVRIAKWWQCF